MNLNPFKRIYQFNKEASLLDQGYSDERECAFPIEEALEGFEDNMQELAFELGLDKGYPSDADEVCHAKHLARYIAGIISQDIVVPDVDRLDKHLDIIVFSLGSIYKLGLSPQQTMKALGIVAEANMQKLKVGQDSEGKQSKPEDFVGPEAQLQKILDER